MRHLLFILLIFSFGCSPKGTQKLKENPTTTAPPVAVDSTILAPVEEEIVEVIAEEDETEAPPYLVAVLKKTPCYGRCPVFEARLFSDGHLTYYGQNEVAKLGRYEAWTEEGLLEQIKQEAYRIQFFQLSEVYPTNGHSLEDIPMTITYLNFDDREKTIINNYESPIALRGFERFLEKLFSDIPWQPMDQ